MLPRLHQLQHLLKLIQLKLRHTRPNPMLMTELHALLQPWRSPIIRPPHPNPIHRDIHRLELQRTLRNPRHHQHPIHPQQLRRRRVRGNGICDVDRGVTPLPRDLANLPDIIRVGFGVENVIGSRRFGLSEGFGGEVYPDDAVAVRFEVLDGEVAEAAAAYDGHPGRVGFAW